MKKIIDSVLGLIVGGIVLTLMFLAVSALYKVVSEQPNDRTVKTPDQEAPVENTATGSVAYELPIELISTPYVPPQQPFGEQYDNTAPRMVLSGSFIDMKLHIRGRVIGEGSKYLILNVNGESGIINATRKSPSELDINKTAASGGVFTAQNGISLTMNLMNQWLGTTGIDFKQNGGARYFSFIKPAEPVSVKPIVVVAFGNDGKYGGAIIESLIIEYACKPGAFCKVEMCPLGKLYTECINNTFGANAMKEWLSKRNG